MSVKLGNTGVRGLFHELNPSLVIKLAQAYATYISRGKIALGIDTRPSGEFMVQAVISGLMSAGCHVYDYGILPTPVLQWLVRHRDFKGGISLSGGHNTFEWNSLIFLGENGAYLSDLEVEEFFNLYHAGRFNRQSFDKLGRYQQTVKHLPDYFRELISGSKGRKKFRFAIDCAFGASERILQEFGRAINIDIVPLFTGHEKRVDKDPEPNIRNAAILSTVVRETNCDGGFLLNSDGTRVLIVDDKGNPLDEELTLPLLARIILEKEKSHIVSTYSSSKIIDQVAERFSVKVYRSDVGPASVIKQAIDLKIKLAGEGSGSFAYTPFSYGYDSYFLISRIVSFLGQKNLTLAKLAEEFPKPHIYKELIPLPPHLIYSNLDFIERMYPSRIKLRDGFYVDYGREWMCVRASSTMAMIRIVVEGRRMLTEIERIKDHIK